MGGGLSYEQADLAAEAFKYLSEKSDKANNDGPLSVSKLAIRQLSLNLQSGLRDDGLLRSQSLPNVAEKPGESPVSFVVEAARGQEETVNARIESPKEIRQEKTAPTEAPSRPKKPNLYVNILSDASDELSVKADEVEPLGTGSSKFPVKSKRKSPRMIISPQSGTIHMPEFRISHQGISPANAGLKSSQGRFGRTALGSEMMRGMDFVEIGSLGTGASGVVVEAIHVPTLTIVALKMLPVYSVEKRQHVSRELAILYKNLAELSLVNESLDQTDYGQQSIGPATSSKCSNLLSLYNAFIDAKSGLVNLVIEYMDGGSLEDLVRYGGCQDEKVLGDISRQTLLGLNFLHQNNNVHRDIKPANILCSSTGIIKIADFGISKAMDGTFGFANSFVGTVCYMSPERITGDNYSFPSDIWSLGLTILAVAKGMFPLDDHRKEPEARVAAWGGTEHGGPGSAESAVHSAAHLHPHAAGQPTKWHGEGGYWGMMKAICDMDPPTPGPIFSDEFATFIDSCLRKDPSSRLPALRLLKEDRFICRHRALASQRRRTGVGAESVTASVVTAVAGGAVGVSAEMRASQAADNKARSRKASWDSDDVFSVTGAGDLGDGASSAQSKEAADAASSVPISAADPFPPGNTPPRRKSLTGTAAAESLEVSPLASRLTRTIVRRDSKTIDERALADAFGGFGLTESVSSSSSSSGGGQSRSRPVSGSTRGVGDDAGGSTKAGDDEFNAGEFDVEEIFAGDELSMINAIRIQHLERIVNKLIFRDERIGENRSSSGKDSDTNLERQDSMSSNVETFDDDADLDDLFECGPRRGQAGQSGQAGQGFVSGTDARPLVGNVGAPKGFEESGSSGCGANKAATEKADNALGPVHSQQLAGSGQGWGSGSDQDALLPPPPLLGTGASRSGRAAMPLLGGNDMLKWEHLAFQLHLPFHVVKYIVERKVRERTLQQEVV